MTIIDSVDIAENYKQVSNSINYIIKMKKVLQKCKELSQRREALEFFYAKTLRVLNNLDKRI